MTPPETQQSTTVTKDRMIWMDGLRGVAIVLIIVLHSAANLGSSGLHVASTVNNFNHFMDPWRLPTLMMLSGMLLGGSLRKPPGTYLMGKVRGILWPYVVWTTIVILTFPWFGVRDAVLALWAPNTYLWYLHTIFICYLIALATRRLNPLSVAGVSWGIALVLWWVTVPEWLVPADPVRFFLMLVYFMVGHAVMSNRDKVFPFIESWWRIVLLLACGVLVGVLDFLPNVTTNTVPVFTLPLVAGIIGGISLARRIRWSSPISRFIRFIGANSIVFYVSHWLFIALSISTIRDLPDWHGLWYLGSVFCIAIVGGIILTYLQKYVLPFRWLFRI